MKEPFQVRELGQHLHVNATQVGNWVKLHNPQLRTQWIHEKDLKPTYGWRERVKDMVREFIEEKP